MNEQFSAYLDNEASRDEADSVVNALLRDETLRHSWRRQHWIREALHSSAAEPQVTLDEGFAGRVMQAIHADAGAAEEAAVPHTALPTADDVAAVDTRVVSISARGRRRRWRGAVGLAVAASAAGLALLVTLPMQHEVGTDNAPLATAATDTAAETAQQPARLAANDSHTRRSGADRRAAAGRVVQNVAVSANDTSARANHWTVSDPAQADRLNDYLVEHNGLARGYGLGVSTPGIVRVAAYGQEAAR